MPTILYLNHLPIPSYVDGAVMHSILQEAFQEENPVRYSDGYGSPTPQADGYSDEERAQIEEHLKALGYF
jgi:hypothetical protein